MLSVDPNKMVANGPIWYYLTESKALINFSPILNPSTEPLLSEAHAPSSAHLVTRTLSREVLLLSSFPLNEKISNISNSEILLISPSFLKEKIYLKDMKISDREKLHHMQRKEHSDPAGYF